jgi:lipopolysaccharide biosynthesis glycosyltransferase
MLRSLYESNPEEDIHVYIIHGPVNEAEKAKLSSYLSGFLRSVSFIRVDPETLKAFPLSGASVEMTVATYYKLILPAVLPSTLQKVLFLDSDLIVVEPLGELMDTPLGDYPVAAVIDRSQKENCKRLGLREGSAYFNSGVMLIDLNKWRKTNILSAGLEVTKGNQAKIEFWDQDILNYLFEGNWLNLDKRWNALPHLWGTNKAAEDEAARDHPAIIHFAGAGNAKPWNYYCAHPWKTRYLELKKKTPWARVPLDCQPPPPSLLFRLKRLVKTALFPGRGESHQKADQL